MNIQTLSLIAVLKDFRTTQSALVDTETGDKKAWREGFCEALRVVETQMVPALENTMKDVIQENEDSFPSHQDLRDQEQRILKWLNDGAPEPGEEWKS